MIHDLRNVEKLVRNETYALILKYLQFCKRYPDVFWFELDVKFARTIVLLLEIKDFYEKSCQILQSNGGRVGATEGKERSR